MAKRRRKRLDQYSHYELTEFIRLYDDCHSMRELQLRSKEDAAQVRYMVNTLVQLGLLEMLPDNRQTQNPIDWVQFIQDYCSKRTLMDVCLTTGLSYREIKRRLNTLNYTGERDANGRMVPTGLDIPVWEVGFDEKVEEHRQFFPSKHSANPQDLARKLRGGRYDDYRGERYKKIDNYTIAKVQNYVASQRKLWQSIKTAMLNR